jgi:hypothetical protein
LSAIQKFEAPVPDQVSETTVKSYTRVALSFGTGLLRLWRAEAASSRLMCALVEFHRTGKAGLDGDQPTFKHLGKIQYSSVDSLVYVTDVSHLIYATTLLDTFLTDTTVFLFLQFPHAMGSNQQVPLRTIIDSASRNEALTHAAKARARDISYLPFSGRIEFLRDKFGLAIAIASSDGEALQNYSSIRNSAVHDQAMFALSLDESGDIIANQKADQPHPIQITGHDVHDSIRTYAVVAKAIANAVFSQVLKLPVPDMLSSWLENEAEVS